jgi:hypothetical protein
MEAACSYCYRTPRSPTTASTTAVPRHMRAVLKAQIDNMGPDPSVPGGGVTDPIDVQAQRRPILCHALVILGSGPPLRQQSCRRRR